MDDRTRIACAAELLRLGAITPGQAHTLAKCAGVSPHEALHAMDRLETLEQNKPTVGQLARYGAIGGAGGGAIGAMGHLIEHGSPLKGATPKAKALNLAANVAKGALGGGAIPLLRSSSDRHAELKKIRGYLKGQNDA